MGEDSSTLTKHKSSSTITPVTAITFNNIFSVAVYLEIIHDQDNKYHIPYVSIMICPTLVGWTHILVPYTKTIREQTFALVWNHVNVC